MQLLRLRWRVLSRHMHCSSPIRFAAVAVLAFSASLTAQPPQTKPPAPAQSPSTLPVTPPTTTPETPQFPLTPIQRPPQRAQVTYANGRLSISADNSSLNQILRQIASDTGMKITGGVSDDRVFGQYGPADPAQVLAQLLDGTGSNMILVHREGEARAELILTPRQGGPTPPNPNAHTVDERSERDEPAPEPARVEEPAQPTIAPPITSPIPPAAPNSASPSNSSQPDSPNGVKTPQQIYEQLQRLRNQQQQPQTTPPQ